MVPAVGKFTVSVFRRNLSGDFIYRHELESNLGIFLGA